MKITFEEFSDHDWATWPGCTTFDGVINPVIAHVDAGDRGMITIVADRCGAFCYIDDGCGLPDEELHIVRNSGFNENGVDTVNKAGIICVATYIVENMLNSEIRALAAALK